MAVRRILSIGLMGVFLAAAGPSVQAQNSPVSQGATLWLSTINGGLMGTVGGAALAALSDKPDDNYEDYMISGAGAGTLAGMAFGMVLITDAQFPTGGGGPAGGGGGPNPPQPGAAFGYHPSHGLWLQSPALVPYPAGPEGQEMGVGLTVLSGRF